MEAAKWKEGIQFLTRKKICWAADVYKKTAHTQSCHRLKSKLDSKKVKNFTALKYVELIKILIHFCEYYT